MMGDGSDRAPLYDAMRKRKFALCVNEFRELASQADRAAPIALGYIYFMGGDGVRRDYRQALRWFEEVNLEDDVSGLVASHLATIYYKGLGVAKNHRAAAKYLRSAALHGHGRSRVLMAILQKKGDGTLRKPRAAETILRASVCDRKLGVIMRLFALISLYP